MTKTQAAIEALDYLRNWQQKDGKASFDESCEEIRSALKAQEWPEKVIIHRPEKNLYKAYIGIGEKIIYLGELEAMDSTGMMQFKIPQSPEVG